MIIYAKLTHFFNITKEITRNIQCNREKENKCVSSNIKILTQIKKAKNIVSGRYTPHNLTPINLYSNLNLFR